MFHQQLMRQIKVLPPSQRLRPDRGHYSSGFLTRHSLSALGERSNSDTRSIVCVCVCSCWCDKVAWGVCVVGETEGVNDSRKMSADGC